MRCWCVALHCGVDGPAAELDRSPRVRLLERVVEAEGQLDACRKAPRRFRAGRGSSRGGELDAGDVDGEEVGEEAVALGARDPACPDLDVADVDACSQIQHCEVEAAASAAETRRGGAAGEGLVVEEEGGA